jgi:hypothetical protein
VKPSAILTIALLAAWGGRVGAESDIGSRRAIKAFNRKAAVHSLVLPGWGQWRKGYPGAGIGLGLLEVGAIGGAVYSFDRAREAKSDFRRGEAPFSRHTRKVDQANYFLIAAGLIWGYGVADAYVGEPRFDRLRAEVDRDSFRLAYRVRF